jgi:tetratricopeptide (TPR) repeat protein
MATAHEVLDLAVRHHQSGHFEQAEPLYLQILDAEPVAADARHLLGLLYHQTGRHQAAVRFIREAIGLNPSAAVFHFNLGTILKDDRQLTEAVACFRRALSLNPSYVDALGNLGIVLKDLGQVEDAVACYRQALRLDPNHVNTLNNLGSALQDLGDLEQAVGCFRQALKLNPRFGVALCNLGVVLRALERLPESITCFEDALKPDPHNGEVLLHLGQALKEQGRLEEAARQFRRVLSLEPENADAHYNLGHALLDQGEIDEAAACFQQATRLKPDWACAHSNLGVALQYLGRLEEAEAAYDQALRREPEHASARLNLSLLRLLTGNFLLAWPDYEFRWKLGRVSEQKTGVKDKASVAGESKADKSPVDSCTAMVESRPVWDGIPLEGKTVLLYAEQGLGDTIQFVRYAPLVKRCGGTVVVTCPPALAHLLQGMTGIDQIVTEGGRLPPIDVQTPILRLPGLFGTTADNIPADVPYLRADPTLVEKWRGQLPPGPRLRVGIVWQGSATHKGDRYRSMPLAQFETLAKVPEVDLVSLQVGPGAQQVADVSFPVIDMGSRFDRKSLDDLAATIANLDLIVSVDTAVVHLAGALGMPVWVLLPFAPDWRWLLERSDSPWYPTMRLFRQTRRGDWGEVLERVAKQLARLQAARHERPGESVRQVIVDLFKDEVPSRSVGSMPSSSGEITEAARRKQVIARKESDVNRWQDPAQLESAWNRRAQLAADLIPSGAYVLDLGCGSMALEGLLPPRCTYVPCDLVARDDRTLVCDFNAGEFPFTRHFTHVTALGVIEYIYDLPSFLRDLRATNRPVVLSYNPADMTRHLDRPALGWVNHLSLAELENALEEAGLAVIVRLPIDGNQVLFRLSPDRPPAWPRCNVVVVSACNVGNFGDRLGYHLINEVLPAHAQVHHATMDFQEGCRIDLAPHIDIDLLVLGIGNSLFGPMLNDDLLRLLESAPRAIGIFGTQYRERLDRGRLDAVLDRLETWYARFEEDVLWYGGGRRNVVHLGDWLISAFPITKGQNPDTLTVGRDVRNNLPLDRTIQQIQSYRRVFSPWLHTLLCAFTSAEEVAYREQREASTGEISGKFRSLLIDVFGRTFPEEQFFAVDRQRVMAYKVKVQKGVAELRRALLGKFGT